MILFIHGFGSCGWGEKSLTLRRHVGVRGVIAPDLPFHPAAAMLHLRSLIDRYPVHALVGSSLGGFYATALNQRRPLPTVLINPVVRPQELLSRYLGKQRRWCDQAPFEVDAGHLDSLQSLHRDRLDAAERYLVLLQRGDEILDYRQAATYYAAKDVIEIEGGSHRFDHFADQLSPIIDWLGHNSVDGQIAQTPA